MIHPRVCEGFFEGLFSNSQTGYTIRTQFCWKRIFSKFPWCQFALWPNLKFRSAIYIKFDPIFYYFHLSKCLLPNSVLKLIIYNTAYSRFFYLEYNFTIYFILYGIDALIFVNIWERKICKILVNEFALTNKPLLIMFLAFRIRESAPGDRKFSKMVVLLKPKNPKNIVLPGPNCSQKRLFLKKFEVYFASRSILSVTSISYSKCPKVFQTIILEKNMWFMPRNWKLYPSPKYVHSPNSLVF